MAIILVVVAWALVEVVLAVAILANPSPKNRPSVFSGLLDLRL